MKLAKTQKVVDPKLYILVYVNLQTKKQRKYQGVHHTLEEARIDAFKALELNNEWVPVQDIWLSADTIEQLFLQCSSRTWVNART